MSVVWGGWAQWEGEKRVKTLAGTRLRVWEPPAVLTSTLRDRTGNHRGSPLRRVKPQRRRGMGLLACVESMGAYLLSDAPAVKAATWSIIVGTFLVIAGEWVYVLGMAGR